LKSAGEPRVDHHCMVTPRPILAVLACALVAFAATDARADNVTDLIGQLKKGSDEKIRLSAVLGLSKLSDQRGVQPLIDALKDSDRNVRGAAAIGLGKVVTSSTKPAMQKAAIAALDAAAKSDKSEIVRTRAKESSKAITALSSSGGTTSSSSGGLPAGTVFVDIGPMSASDAKLKAAMRATTQAMLGKSASSWATAWPGGKTPTAAQLKNIHPFHVDGNVVEVKVSGDVVSCKISMLIATYPDKSMFGFLKGGASVQGGTTDRDKADCVNAVVEDMVMKKIVPAIQSKVP
jgi:hypothetical protein